MTFPVWMDNLIAYGLQIAILASAGTLLAYTFRLRVPRVSLIYWQILLLACLLLPALQPWNHPIHYQMISAAMPLVSTITAAPVPIVAETSASITPEIIGAILIGGIGLRLLWLALGFLRLQFFLRDAQLLPAGVHKDASARLGIHARFFLSHKIDSPATVGIFSPKVILPPSYPGMKDACKEAIICHELLHVSRRDWAMILFEEIIRALYWFHPAVWWLLERIDLAREQSIDHEVVHWTGSKQLYLDSLLEIARSRGRPKVVPAPLFLRERHLVHRVALLIKEVSMNRMQLAISLAAAALLLTGTIQFASAWFPFTGEPVVIRQQSNQKEISDPAPQNTNIAKPIPVKKATRPVPVAVLAVNMGSSPQGTGTINAPAAPMPREPIRVGDRIQESKLIHKVAPIYPELAMRARVSGKVVLSIKVNEQGFVEDVQVMMAHPLLRDAAVDAVKQWQYSPTLLNGEPVPVLATVTVVFNLREDPMIGGKNFQEAVPIPPPPPPQPTRSPFRSVVSMNVQGYVIGLNMIMVNENGSMVQNPEPFIPPQIDTSPEIFAQWIEMLKAGWPANVPKDAIVGYQFVFNESGEISQFSRIQGPAIPELENELSHLRIVSPGRSDEVPSPSFLCVMQIRWDGQTR
jgi:TonB family protein